MSKAPAFQFYPADYLADSNVAMMSLEAEGAYIRLMAYCWREEGIPSNIESIAKLCRVTPEKMIELWPMLSPCFYQKTENILMHPRLEKEKKKLKSYSKTQSELGKKGAEKRWRKESTGDSDRHSDPINSPMAKNSFSSSSSSSSSCLLTKEKVKKEKPMSEFFEKFWQVYPNKKSKAEAIKIWRRDNLDLKANEIMAGLNAYLTNPNWLKDGGKWIPLPTTFLNQERWTDQQQITLAPVNTSSTWDQPAPWMLEYQKATVLGHVITGEMIDPKKLKIVPGWQKMDHPWGMIAEREWKPFYGEVDPSWEIL